MLSRAVPILVVATGDVPSPENLVPLGERSLETEPARRYAINVRFLNPTPPSSLVDSRGRPYFLWDMDMTLEEFRREIADPDPGVRAYLVGKIMRQAKPDDVFGFVTVAEIRRLWPLLERYLGRSRRFWTWLLDCWAKQHDDG